MCDFLDTDDDTIWDMPPAALAFVVLFPLTILGGQWIIGRRARGWLGAILPTIWVVFCVTAWVHRGDLPGSPLGALSVIGAQIMLWLAGRSARRRTSDTDG